MPTDVQRCEDLKHSPQNERCEWDRDKEKKRLRSVAIMAAFDRHCDERPNSDAEDQKRNCWTVRLYLRCAQENQAKQKNERRITDAVRTTSRREEEAQKWCAHLR